MIQSAMQLKVLQQAAGCSRLSSARVCRCKSIPASPKYSKMMLKYYVLFGCSVKQCGGEEGGQTPPLHNRPTYSGM